MSLIVQTFYISTGAKNAMHTLRCRRDAAACNPAFMPDFYIKNLAVDVDEAQAKALAHVDAFKARVGDNRDDFKIVVELEPEYDIKLRRGRLSAFETSAIEAIERGEFPFGKHKGKRIEDGPESYVLFFADKLHTAGEDNVVMLALASACLGVALEKGYIAARDAKREARKIAEAASVHVGTVGERRNFRGQIVASFFKRYQEGVEGGYYINKVMIEGNLIVCIGAVKLGDTGSDVTFKATIKEHSNYQGVKSTKVNRPKVAA